MNVRWAIILATGLILAAFIHGGIYTMVAAGEGGSHDLTGIVFAYRVNKFTGAVAMCVRGRTTWCGPARWVPLDTK